MTMTFKNCILSIILILLFAFGAAASENKITDISFVGLKNIKVKTVKSEINSKVKKPYSDEKVKNDIKALLELGYFDDVEVSVDTTTWKLTFMLREKPQIKEISFKGNKKLSRGKLMDEMAFKEKEFYDVSKLEESKTKIKALYADKGYADMKMEVYPTLDELENKMTITILITEGNRILIGDVKVTGVKAYKPKKILGLMSTKKKKVFKTENFDEDKKAIETFYKNNGYMDVSIKEPQITYDKDRTLMFIDIPLVEGIKFKIDNVSFSGNEVFTTKELEKELEIKKGIIYNEEKLQETLAALHNKYADKGYLNCRIEPIFTKNEEKALMDVNFDIKENNIVYVGNIYVDGLTNTKEFVIRREILLKEGDVFAATKVRRSMEKINNLGFIDSVEPQVQPTRDPNIMDLAFQITEGKPGMLSAGAGYSSVDLLVGTIQLQHMNLFGLAQRLNLMWEFGALRNSYQIDWTEPWFLGKPMSLGVSGFNTSRILDYGNISAAYTEGRIGGSVRVSPRLSDRMSLGFSYTYEKIDIFNISASAPVALTSAAASSNGVTSSVLTQFILDSRDNIFDASRGNRQSLSLQVAGGPLGGDQNFLKEEARSSWFFPLIWKFVFSLAGAVGEIESFNPSSDVPFYQRYYVGGGDTVRGYNYRGQIGPDNGGKMMMVYNAEIKFPIVAEKKRSILQGAFFADVGGDWNSANDFRFTLGTDPNDMKAGFGFGIRFTTPVFPLRLDWGYGINHKPGEALSQFYFTIGNVF